MNDDGHFEGGKKPPLKAGKTSQDSLPHLRSSTGRDGIRTSQMARDVYHHPLRINFNIRSRSYFLANMHRFT